MQVTDCKVMNSAKELALHTIKSELIFGGTNGITYFNPAEITNSSKKPEIRITDFYIHDKMVKRKGWNQ